MRLLRGHGVEDTGLRRSGHGLGPATDPIAALFANGEPGDEWVASRDWCYTKTGGGDYEPVTTSGDAVARIVGKHNGTNADQDDVAKRPIYTEGGGRSWLAFDGANDEIGTAASFDLSAADVTFLVAGAREAGSGSYGAAYGDTFQFLRADSAGGFLRAATGSGDAAVAGYGTSTAARVIILEADRDTGLLSAEAMPGSSSTDTSTAWPTAWFATPSNVMLGAARPGVLNFDGRIYGAILRGSASTSGEIAAARNHLAAIAGAL